MPVDATAETFHADIAEGNVLVDFWGPRCQPCLALMPAVEALEERHAGRLKLVKVNATENRGICRELSVLGLPTYMFFRDGAEVERLTGDPKRDDIEAAVVRLIEHEEVASETRGS
jgi:thioredoxin 1